MPSTFWPIMQTCTLIVQLKMVLVQFSLKIIIYMASLQ